MGFCSSAVKVWRGWKLCFCLCSPSLCIFRLKKTRSNFCSSFRPLKGHPKRQLIKSKRLDNGVTLLNHQATELVDSQREGSRGRNVDVKALLVTFPLLCIYISFRVSGKARRSVLMVTQRISGRAGVKAWQPAPLVTCAVLSFLVAAAPAQPFLQGWHCTWSHLLALISFPSMIWKGCRAGAGIYSDLQLHGQMCPFVRPQGGDSKGTQS